MPLEPAAVGGGSLAAGSLLELSRVKHQGLGELLSRGGDTHVGLAAACEGAKTESPVAAEAW